MKYFKARYMYKGEKEDLIFKALNKAEAIIMKFLCLLMKK